MGRNTDWGFNSSESNLWLKDWQKKIASWKINKHYKWENDREASIPLAHAATSGPFLLPTPMSFPSAVIDEEWQRTQCSPRETCVEVASELGRSTNRFFKPPCVSVFRCGGCCNEEGLVCMNTSTSYVSKQVWGRQQVCPLHRPGGGSVDSYPWACGQAPGWILRVSSHLIPEIS